jgi:Ser/Thr protein kinase RdoA (MazF antagonist)
MTRRDEARILQWHADRVAELLSELRADTLPAIVIHGDFAPWNLRFHRGKLSGIFDFDLSHLNHRVADFALSWRGMHDEVVHGYMEIDQLSEIELELITPVWWAWLLAGARSQLTREANSNLDWVMTHITRRSPLMPPKLMAQP